MSLLKRLLGTSSLQGPQGDDTDTLWRELESHYLGIDWATATLPMASGPEFPAWLEKFGLEAAKSTSAQLAVEQAPSAPPPRYGQLLRVRRFGSTKLTGAYLTSQLWAYIFVHLLRLTDSVLARAAADGKPLDAIGFLPDLFLLVLAKRAAETAGWRCPPELQQEWTRIKTRLRHLRAEDREHWQNQGTPKL